jgi:hypothetical protein
VTNILMKTALAILFAASSLCMRGVVPAAAAEDLVRAKPSEAAGGAETKQIRSADGLVAWRNSLAERLEKEGRSDTASQIKAGTLPRDWALQRAGDLGIALQTGTNGVRLWSLYDLGSHIELLASNQPSLFTAKLFNVQTRKETDVVAEQGWQQVRIRAFAGGFSVRWEKPVEAELAGLSVVATAKLDRRNHALRWGLKMEGANRDWSIRRVSFPQLALADLGKGGAVVFPRGPGEAQRDVWGRAFKYSGQYPGGWCSMQWMAAYQGTGNPTGLYIGLHDPWGSTKDLRLESNPTSRSVRLSVDHPAPGTGVGGNSFVLSGEADWQLLRGDWFDAATIYKTWARREARWWPRLGRNGREDTPMWMRELCAWAMTGGKPEECVGPVRQFQEFLGVPVGFHWYNWHQIPFDNDYPHYFPAKVGFEMGIRNLQTNQVLVMPYINGRLWDTHDRGAEDFQFSQVALAAASKDKEGKPYLEKYGSKETNGNPVELAVMCPAAPYWQQTVRDIVLKLLKECGTRAVYIDQVAAAAPTLCMDSTHGHPLGGGHWWNEGYWKMLRAIRDAMPAGSILTTECNGEPFVRWFDGYLTWHWQFDGQVPAFPAVYGGAVQMFGRAYRAGATKDLALRMKAGQQLVFGEQLGWIDPGVIKEPENAAFFRDLVKLRFAFRRYFYAGEMARPPKLTGSLPTVRADWQWSGEWPVTTDAVLTGAWRIPTEKRLLLLFVNVSDKPVASSVILDPVKYGMRAQRVHRTTWLQGQSHAEDSAWLAGSERSLILQPRQATAWELAW